MSKINIIRAWKDEEYCNSLSDEERALVPDNPAGFIEVADDELQNVAGGTAIMCPITIYYCTIISCLVNCGAQQVEAAF